MQNNSAKTIPKMLLSLAGTICLRLLLGVSVYGALNSPDTTGKAICITCAILGTIAIWKEE